MTGRAAQVDVVVMHLSVCFFFEQRVRSIVCPTRRAALLLRILWGLEQELQQELPSQPVFPDWWGLLGAITLDEGEVTLAQFWLVYDAHCVGDSPSLRLTRDLLRDTDPRPDALSGVAEAGETKSQTQDVEPSIGMEDPRITRTVTVDPTKTHTVRVDSGERTFQVTLTEQRLGAMGAPVAAFTAEVTFRAKANGGYSARQCLAALANDAKLFAKGTVRKEDLPVDPE